MFREQGFGFFSIHLPFGFDPYENDPGIRLGTTAIWCHPMRVAGIKKKHLPRLERNAGVGLRNAVHLGGLCRMQHRPIPASLNGQLNKPAILTFFGIGISPLEDDGMGVFKRNHQDI